MWSVSGEYQLKCRIIRQLLHYFHVQFIISRMRSKQKTINAGTMGVEPSDRVSGLHGVGCRMGCG